MPLHILLPLVALGTAGLLILLWFHSAMVLFAGAPNLTYRFWIHTEAIGRMPRWFEAAMNTPSHHRVHRRRHPR